MKNIGYAGLGNLLLLAVCLLFALSASANAQFSQNSSRSLFSDVKAFKTGDAIMVYIVEDTQAGNSASTTESRSTNLSGGLEAGANLSDFRGDLGVGTGNSHGAEGANSRKEKIRAKLSARVVEVDAESGNLVVEGKRTTKVNGETQTIIIKGMVRPVDVSPDNSVYSYSILDLTLYIEGDGNITKVQEPGLITKFIRLLF